MPTESTDRPNPLGLNLDFMFGRGFLWADRERLSDWITLEALRMEIPDLSFPFDARGGLDRFRSTRCLVREIEFAISEVGLGDLLRHAAEELERFSDLEVRFLEDAVHISVRLNAFGSNTFVSFRAALIPPEPPRVDELHLSLYDYRAFGPLPYPARLVAFELMTGLLNTSVLRPPGRGESFTIGVAGDILSMRPLKLLLLHIFPRVGWKLPNLSTVALEGAKIRPGVLTIRATSRDEDWKGGGNRNVYQLGGTQEGARALAAYEAKDMFANADQALFDGQIRQAMDLLAGYRDVYGLHRELVSRTLDCLLADPTPSHLAEVEALSRELAEDEGDELLAALARPVVATVRGNRGQIVERFQELADLLKERGDTADWILAQLALAQEVETDDPERAADALREVLKISPRNRVALEQLRALYDRLGETAQLEDVLKRLTGVYTDRETLKQTYLQLARHLIDREGELSEARLYLEKVLRLDPSELEALNTLGESYLLSDEPLRALKAFGSAARAAESEDDEARAMTLHFRVARIWSEHLEDAGQALLSCRRALSLAPDTTGDFERALERIDMLSFAGELSAARERLEEATDYWMEAVNLLDSLPQRAIEDVEAREGGPGVQDRLLEAHHHLADLYRRRERGDAAASHLRRILQVDPTDAQARESLRVHLLEHGRTEQLIEIYGELTEDIDDRAVQVDLQLELARTYRGMELLESAREHYLKALELDPSSEAARRELIEMLERQKLWGELRDALNTMLIRTRDKDTRWELSIRMGRVLAEQFGQYRNSAQRLFEAVQIRPTHVPTLRSLSRALAALVERDGPDVDAPAGSGSAGRLLERIYMKLAELEPDPDDQLDALDNLADLAEERGDGAAAAEARGRAERLRELHAEPEARDLEERLDDLVGTDVEDLAEPTSDDSHDTPAPDTTPRYENPLAGKMELPTPEDVSEAADDGSDPATVADDAPDETPSADADDERLAEFRSRYEEMFKQPPDEQPTSRVPRPEDGPEPPRPRGDDADGGERDLASLREAYEQAKASGGAGDQADAAEALLEAARGGDVELPRSEKMRLHKEAGELRYYELEESAAARQHFEYLRENDPDGFGGDQMVLTTLESIYEEDGDFEERLDILESRLENAQTDEMEATYRLLIAQLHWDERDDADEARAVLAPLLERDPRHEAANRMLAELAQEQGKYEEAARRLETVLKVAGGGLDTVELERQLAQMLLDELDRPERALEHFANVLDAAPGDAMALEGVKECQAMLEDWKGYLSSLGKELGLLVGRPDGIDLTEPQDIDPESMSSAVRVPASQIVADGAHIAEENIGRHELAHGLWGKAFELWPEHVDALERRIALDRTLGDDAALAADLESMAELLLDADARFDALYEAATLLRDELGRPEDARPLLTEAIAVVRDADEPPETLPEARRALKALDQD
jgi:tetratricopeptide (TPR) repeat protein